MNTIKDIAGVMGKLNQKAEDKLTIREISPQIGKLILGEDRIGVVKCEDLKELGKAWVRRCVGPDPRSAAISYDVSEGAYFNADLNILAFVEYVFGVRRCDVWKHTLKIRESTMSEKTGKELMCIYCDFIHEDYEEVE